ncbi:MAG: queuosine precursor transporter [Chloroflexi bacterium]|nr:queuosine precursor transporter [Chloroflexota bacterium]
MPTKQYRFYDLIMALFVTMLLLSNLLSSAKIIDMGIALGSIRLIFDAGTLVFPISYIFGDILTEVYGYARSRRVIWAGFAATALMGFFTWLAGVLPGESDWQQYAGQTAYDAILGGISGLIVASLIAYWVGEFSNSYVIAKMKVAARGRRVWSRTIASTVVGQAVDTVTFFSIAVLLGVFPAGAMFSLIITNYVMKVGVEVVLTPVTLRVISSLKAAEKEDYYDNYTRFNPFRLEV